MSDGGGDGGGMGGGVQVSAGLYPKILIGTIASSCVLGFFNPTWNVVRDVPELQSLPYDPRIALAVKYSSTAAAFCLPWNFIFCLLLFAPELVKNREARVILGLLTTLILGGVDVAWLSLVAMSLSWHWSLLGKPFASCGEAGHPYEDGTPSFFTVVGTHVNKSAEGVCQDLSKGYVAEGFLIVTLAVGAGLILGLVCQAFCFAPRLLAAAFRGVVQGVSWLVRRIYSRVRFALGYVGKLGRRRTTFNFGNRTRIGDLEMNGPSPTSNFAKIIGLRERSGDSLLVPYLHFADVISISMVKAVRATLSTRTRGFDRDLLRKETCINGSKTDCWGCGNQICRDCTTSRDVADPETTEHVENCITVCSSCYYKHCCGSSQFHQPQMGQTCRHVEKTKESEARPRELCSLCSRRKTDEIQLSRQRKEAGELKQLESATAFCAVCESSLPVASPRWWACSVCKTECKSRLHTQWVAKRGK